MYLLDHPAMFKDGTRVMMLKGRHKDGLQVERTVTRVTHNQQQFEKALTEFKHMSVAGERIYGSAGPRDIQKAAREFKRRQLDADYDADPMRFYRHINDRWVSALMQTTAQKEKVWLFDCDTDRDTSHVQDELKKHYDRGKPYVYDSKSGTHIIVQPFNKALINELAKRMIHENPIMLCGY